MLVVHDNPRSLCAQRVRFLLAELALPYERRLVELAAVRPDWHLEVNPAGGVPALVDGDFHMAESVAILRYLAARENRGDLYPNDLRERATLDWLLDGIISELRPAVVEVSTAAYGPSRGPGDLRRGAGARAGAGGLRRSAKAIRDGCRRSSGRSRGLASVGSPSQTWPLRRCSIGSGGQATGSPATRGSTAGATPSAAARRGQTASPRKRGSDYGRRLNQTRERPPAASTSSAPTPANTKLTSRFSVFEAMSDPSDAVDLLERRVGRRVEELSAGRARDLRQRLAVRRDGNGLLVAETVVHGDRSAVGAECNREDLDAPILRLLRCLCRVERVR